MKAVHTAYKAGKRRLGGQRLFCVYLNRYFRKTSSKTRIINTMRNTILLSLLLGLTWVMALIPHSLTQQYIAVILNGSMGMYILGIYKIIKY